MTTAKDRLTTLTVLIFIIFLWLAAGVVGYILFGEGTRNEQREPRPSAGATASQQS